MVSGWEGRWMGSRGKADSAVVEHAESLPSKASSAYMDKLGLEPMIELVQV